MVAFGANRRHNAVQLSNSLIFLAAGVTERVSAYLNYIGISSSRRTAHAALKTLGTGAIEKIKARFKLTQSSIIAPFLCYNNLDFEEKVHMGSLSHDSRMFHGTWAYIHSASPSLLGKLDPAELTIDVLNNALHSGTKMTIRSSMFTSTVESTEHWGKALKSQIVWVILRYIAKPVDGRVKLDKSPPAVHPISPEDPNTNVLKLMIASDNSAAGVGEVFTGVIQQSGLTPEEFHLRLQIIEGNLASCNIFETLKRQRCPAVANHESLNNVFTKDARDTGAWRTLHALAIKAVKPVTKKDLNLMLCYVQQIHEATLMYCVSLVANRAHIPVSEELLEVSSETIE
ncbi:hypothetical protein PSTG_06880 [Puccinia striiformis f. sp. tritici PST-78]|uniref:DUF6589 domain-containing protein n=1 Tax=Puccinia striiformis f. sp. tritici PST-78 TaxID=1165861 RepID=A0A0L0VKI6_9BASI|nr:hypothetical protein PSTG_06880 [Puccinia striiformis f. sp. tritici PST-78]